MWILGQKNCQKCTKPLISQFAIFAKVTSLKTLRLLHFSIFLLETFKISVETFFDQKIFGKNLTADFQNLPGKFRNLTKFLQNNYWSKIVSTDILKVSNKDIEKCGLEI